MDGLRCAKNKQKTATETPARGASNGQLITRELELKDKKKIEGQFECSLWFADATAGTRAPWIIHPHGARAGWRPLKNGTAPAHRPVFRPAAVEKDYCNMLDCADGVVEYVSRNFSI